MGLVMCYGRLMDCAVNYLIYYREPTGELVLLSEEPEADEDCVFSVVIPVELARAA